MFEDVCVFLSKSEWSLLMELASSRTDGQTLKLGKMNDDMKQ